MLLLKSVKSITVNTGHHCKDSQQKFIVTSLNQHLQNKPEIVYYCSLYLQGFNNYKFNNLSLKNNQLNTMNHFQNKLN